MKGESEKCRITGLWDDEILFKFGHLKSCHFFFFLGVGGELMSRITDLCDDEILYKFGHLKLPRVVVDISLSVLFYYFFGEEFV